MVTFQSVCYVPWQQLVHPIAASDYCTSRFLSRSAPTPNSIRTPVPGSGTRTLIWWKIRGLSAEVPLN